MRPLCLLFLYCFALSAQTSLLKHVIAGPGDSGDGGPSTSAWLRYPVATTSDLSGNLYITDAVCGCIRKVSTDGTINVVAGGGFRPIADGVPATEASVGSIYGIAVAANGDLYFSSTSNRILSMGPDGLLRIFAGTGLAGFSEDGGAATAAWFNGPEEIKFGPDGSLFVADRYNYRVRRIAPDGIISTVAGNGTPGLSGDGGPATTAQLDVLVSIAVDSNGTLYIADSCRIRKVTADGVIRNIAGSSCGYSGDGGPALMARMESESGLAIDGSGNLYLAESSLRVRMISTDGIISTIAGDGGYGVPDEGVSAGQAEFGYPYRLSIDTNNNVYITDLHNKRVFRLDSTGTVATVAGSEDPMDGGPATRARLSFPSFAVADAQNNVYFADSWAGVVRKIGRDDNISTVAGKGNRGEMGDGEGGPGTSARIGTPSSLAFDAAGNLFISSSGVYHRVMKLTPSGVITTFAGTGAPGFSGDGGPATDGQLKGVSGMAFDPAGNLYLADSLNNAIRKVTPAGIISTYIGGRAGYFGDGGPAAKALLNNPQGLFFDSKGNLYIADHGNSRVRKVTPEGVITTIAGDGRPGIAGDGGPAVEASLAPSSVAVDGSGNIYIADTDNHKIRHIGLDGIISSVATVGTASNISLAPDGTLMLTEGTWSQVSRLAP
jgi:sugar lactone lactonase YvrE